MGTLIPYLYFYSIKMPTNINPKWWENMVENHKMFWKNLKISWNFLCWLAQKGKTIKGRSKPIRKLGWYRPKTNLGQDRPKKQKQTPFYKAGLGLAAWARLMVQPEATMDWLLCWA